MRKYVILAVLICLLTSCVRKPHHDGAPLRCAISMSRDDAGKELLCGYNYELAKRFAMAEGREADIHLEPRSAGLLASLKQGKLDLVVLPYSSGLEEDSLLVWNAADSSGIWVFPASDQARALFARKWLHRLHTEEGYAKLRQPYMDIYNPMKRVSADFISPYDSLIRVYADTLGWDWKMLAALIYQESKFHIEAQSPKGAAGLMQLVPNTARKFGCEDWLNPEDNIRAGVMMLKSVEKKYRRIAADRKELAKFTMAAYNAGASRIQDCINYARHRGVDVSRWDNVAAVIPDMKHDSIASLDTIKLGRFHGRETVSYVNRIHTYYDRYRHICP